MKTDVILWAKGPFKRLRMAGDESRYAYSRWTGEGASTPRGNLGKKIAAEIARGIRRPE